jgi:outer membrane protein assembly factor BamA
MRLRLAHIALCVWLLISQQPIHAQRQTPANESSQDAVPCLSAFSQDEPPSDPGVSISEVTFSGFIEMSVAEQDEIASSIKRETHGYSVDSVVEEALERARAGWQNHGYFKVQISGEGKALKKNGTGAQIALFVHVDEYIQFRLGKITFRNNRVIQKSALLRELFPIRDGDVFSREKIAEGLEKLRKVYGEYGYINYTAIPSTTFDDDEKLAFLDVFADEGKQFYVSSVDVIGVDAATEQKILKDFPAGQIFNSRLFELFLKKYSSLFAFSTNDPLRVKKHLDELAGTVSITLDVRPCPVE